MALAKRRSRSENGGGSSIVHTRPSLPKTLENEYLAGRAAEAAAKHSRTSNRPLKRGKKSTLDPLLVLQVRALKEFAGWTRRELAASFEWPVWKVDQVLNYYQLAHITPTEKDAPLGRAKPTVEDGRCRKRVVLELTMPRFLTLKEYSEAELRLGEEG